MRIQLASDLHLEHLENFFPGTPTISPAHGADLLVLAGDIGRGVRALNLFRNWPVPVLYVAGNHEAYGAVWADTINALREAARNTSVRFGARADLARNVVRIRSARGWSQEDLAREADMHRTFITQIERQRRNITIDNLEKLANTLGVPLSDLFSSLR